MPKIGTIIKPTPCVACEGCGRSTSNEPCYPCKGTGVQGGKGRPDSRIRLDSDGNPILPKKERKKDAERAPRRQPKPAPDVSTMFD